MTLNRNLLLALTVTGGAAVAALLAVRRHAPRPAAPQHGTELQRWETEHGRPMLSTFAVPPSRPAVSGAGTHGSRQST